MQRFLDSDRTRVNRRRALFRRRPDRRCLQARPLTSERPGRDALNASDSIYAQSHGTTIVSVRPGDSSYAGTVRLGIQS
jgi:hypothetical protein